MKKSKPSPPKPMRAKYYHAQSMIDYGGAFASRLGAAYLAADSDNASKLETYFAEIFARYDARAADLRKAEFDQKELELKGTMP